jgi:hypothetical protein
MKPYAGQGATKAAFDKNAVGRFTIFMRIYILTFSITAITTGSPYVQFSNAVF